MKKWGRSYPFPILEHTLTLLLQSKWRKLQNFFGLLQQKWHKKVILITIYLLILVSVYLPPSSIILVLPPPPSGNFGSWIEEAMWFKRGHGPVDNICGLWLIVLFSSFLMPNSRMEFKGFLLDYFLNLDELHFYNWAGVIRSHIFYNMQKCHDGVVQHETNQKFIGPYIL